MEEHRMFGGGLNSDFNSQNQPENTYRYAENWIRDVDGSMRTELGTSKFSNIPDKYVLDTTVIEDIVIFYLFDELGNHEIGYTNKDDVYTSVIVSSKLNFSKANKLRSRGRVDYRGHRIAYFVDGLNPNRIVDIDKSYLGIVDLEGELKLQVDASPPQVNFVSIDSDGELPTGIYQFQARLLTSSGNASIVSLATNPIPVVDEISGMVDGAEPQSPSTKSIVVDITNIDLKFKFVEIIVTTYVGVTNTPKINVVSRKAIVGSTMRFRYQSLTQNLDELDVNEVTIEPIIYESGKHIEYKDGHLLIAGLKGKKEGLKFQEVANNISVQYVVTEISFAETFSLKGQSGREDLIIPESEFGGKQGYAIEANSVNLKGLMRNEVYSLSISPEYTDGTIGNAYHIPGAIRYDGFGSHRAALPIAVGSGFCGTYVSEAAYPLGFGYPDGFMGGKVRHHLMPTLAQEPAIANGMIRVLGLKLTGIDLSIIPIEERKSIKGYVIGYQRRTNINKSILTQGIVQPLIKDPKSNEVWVSPFHGKGVFNSPDSVAWVSATNSSTTTWSYYRDTHAFYSPETTILNDNISADFIDRVAVARGKGYVVASELSGGYRDTWMHTFMDFTAYDTNVPGDPAAPNSQGIYKDTIAYVPAHNSTGKFTPPNFRVSGATVSTKENNGFLFFHTNGNVPIWNNYASRDNEQGVTDVEFQSNDGKGTATYILRRSNVLHGPDGGGLNWFDTSRSIYNLRAVRTSQYGEVNDAEYVYMGRGNGTQVIIYNGDTFINKVSLFSQTGEPNIDNGADREFKTLNYIFLESTVNTNYRHYKEVGGAEKGTVPYFPKQRVLWNKNLQNGLFQVSPSFGHSNTYNRQYSFDNGLKKYFPKSLLTEEEVNVFDNRCIYSELSIEGEQFDGNRLFLPNNYQDIPKHKGVITDMFVHSNSLYFHTLQTLFKAFFNEQVTQVTSAGEVSLGNGGVFNRPAMEIFTINGGYAGSIGGGLNTPFGRIFADGVQGKVFMLTEGVSEISMKGLSKYFLSNLTRKDTCISAYDYKNRRALLTIGGRYTISYMPELESWSSFHSYLPTHIFSTGNRVIMSVGNTIHEINLHTGLLLGNIYWSALHVTFNKEPLLTKVQDNLFVQSSHMFDGIRGINGVQDTGNRTILMENAPDESYALCKLRNSQYQLPVPRATDNARMRGKYITLELNKDNKNNQTEVKYISLIFRANAR